MSLRAATPEVASGYKKFDANDLPAFDVAVNGCIDVLDENGIQGIRGEPDVFIILRHNGSLVGQDKLVDATVFVGASIPEIIKELTQQQS